MYSFENYRYYKKNDLSSLQNLSNHNVDMSYSQHEEVKPQTPIIKNKFNKVKKKMICFSVINNDKCSYGNNCVYCHSYFEQSIDPEKEYVYKIIIDKNLNNFYDAASVNIENIYKRIAVFTNECEQCKKGSCPGGYNCKYGTFHPTFKLCKSDFQVGECINQEMELKVDTDLFRPFTDSDKTIKPCDKYYGCINGHHLTKRGFIPYHKHINEREKKKNNGSKAYRYIEIQSLGCCLDESDIDITSDSSSSSD